MIKKLLLAILFLPLSFCFGQSQNCEREKISDRRDLPEMIPGETMGQKLESLLFWSDEEKERRFPIMHSIYPSVEVESGEKVHPLEFSKKLKFCRKKKNYVDTYLAENHLAGVIVIHKGKIRLEAYNNNTHQNTLWTSFSVAKSIASMLVGVALKEGDITDMDDELQKYIPEFRRTDYGVVTVRQLLTMTSGIGWNEDYADPNSDVAQMYTQPCEGNEAHILTYMKSLKSANPPGTHWNYSTGETDLIGILIQKATGKTMAEYLSEKIWKPMGMQQCGYWLADECSGMNIGGSGLSASLRDYARLGLLMLDNGKINDESIFAKEWIDGAYSNLQQTHSKGEGYGYLWWRDEDGSYSANGIFGQTIYINPAKKLVVVQFGAWPYATSNEFSASRAKFFKSVQKSL